MACNGCKIIIGIRPRKEGYRGFSLRVRRGVEDREFSAEIGGKSRELAISSGSATAHEDSVNKHQD